MRKHWYTDPMLLGVQTSWALTFVFIKGALGPDGGFSPFAFVWLRMLLSATVLFALMPILGEPVRIPWSRLKKTVLVGVIGLGLYHLLFTYALSLTTPVDTALIIGTGPVITALWMPLFGMERTHGRGWLGIVICFASVAAIAVYGAFQGGSHAGWDLRRLTGDAIMLVASACWALNGIFCRRALPHVPPVTITAYGMLWATLALLPFCSYSMFAQDWSAVTLKGWWGFGWAVMPASTLSIIFFYFGVKNVGPLHTIIYQNVAPVITAAAVFFMAGTPPSVVQVAGVFTIFFGVWLTRTSRAPGAQTRGKDEPDVKGADDATLEST